MATNDAFVSALGTGLTVSAVVAAIAAVVAGVPIQRKLPTADPAIAKAQVPGQAAAPSELAA